MLVHVFIIHDLASLYKLNITVKMFPSIVFDYNFNHRNVLFKYKSIHFFKTNT